MKIVNRTTHLCDSFTYTNFARERFNVVILKETFCWNSNRRAFDVAGSDGRELIVDADTFYGEAGESSIRLASDLAAYKPGTDIYFVDPVAYSPDGVPRGSWECSVQIDSQLHSLRVLGPRQWERGVLGWSLSDPLPESKVAVRHELAFGGVDRFPDKPPMTFEQNPVGKGFQHYAAQSNRQPIAAPQVEAVEESVNKLGSIVRPAGLTPIGRAWSPRLSFAGTYDDRWLKEQWPYLPRDYRPEYELCAPRELQAKPFLRGNEQVTIRNLTPTGIWDFQLPMPADFVVLLPFASDGAGVAVFKLDTLAIFTEQLKIAMCWRAAFFVPNTTCDVFVMQL